MDAFDQVLEMPHLGGHSLPHAVLMMIPEVGENNTLRSNRNWMDAQESVLASEPGRASAAPAADQVTQPVQTAPPGHRAWPG